jgi:cysteine desulfurase / selenocysteine lyase
LTATLDIQQLRKEFPILHQQVNGCALVYLDNAATTQKPKSVIDAITDYYKNYNANVHRGAHYLANKATEAFEATRQKTKTFINAAETAEIIFTSGTTDAINLVAQTWARTNLVQGDEILLTMMEHHSNIVPWQMVAEEKGAIIKVLPINEKGEWKITELNTLLTPKTKLVAVNHVSNSLGTINNVQTLINKAHAAGAKVLIDGAQAVAHFAVDVQALDCDFYCFSAHKLYGPTGVGVLYGKRELLEAMPPYRGGGEMIKSVSFEKTFYNELPHKFEAGTPNIEGVVALGAALDFVNDLDWEAIAEHEKELLQYATSQMLQIDGVKIFGTADYKVGVISFEVQGVHPYDLGTLLDKQGVAVRTGQHCTEPLWNFFGVSGSVRASFAAYNTLEEVDVFMNALKKAISLLR